MSDAPRPSAFTTFPLIFAAPSGAGKTSLARELAARRDDVVFSISCTTRPPRPAEKDGADYHFRTVDQFRRMVAAGDLLEWAEVHGNLYGTPRSNLEQARARHHFLLLDIDVQGSRQIKSAAPESVSIFVLPPSADELARRLVGRGSEDAEVRRRRLLAARGELASAGEFDYLVINDDLTRAADTVEVIIAAESARTTRQAGLSGYVASLISGIDEIL